MKDEAIRLVYLRYILLIILFILQPHFILIIK